MVLVTRFQSTQHSTEGALELFSFCKLMTVYRTIQRHARESLLCYFKRSITVNIRFRDRKYGHKLIGSFVYRNKKTRPWFSDESSYYSLFLDELIFNESCYACPFANEKRCGDITLGDFWGIKYEYPTFFINNELREDVPVSAVMVNSIMVS